MIDGGEKKVWFVKFQLEAESVETFVSVLEKRKTRKNHSHTSRRSKKFFFLKHKSTATEHEIP